MVILLLARSEIAAFSSIYTLVSLGMSMCENVKAIKYVRSD